MTTRNKLLATTLAGLMAASPIGAIGAFAADAVETAAAAEATAQAPYKTQQGLLKTADAALATLANARQARLALLDNQIDVARTHIADATRALTEGESDLQALRIAGSGDTEAGPDYLPFDLSMALSESFRATGDTRAALEKANGLMQAGDKDAAIDVLRVASIDVNISAALLPEASSMDHLKQAAALIDQEDYFAANLALKEIEDSVLVRSFGINAIPQQGDLG
ncbi:MAG: YfdX family protein [Rhodobacteraceae bacterium]|nr:MAG: YfdX family protein [Paracoccaceae bacterium]